MISSLRDLTSSFSAARTPTSGATDLNTMSSFESTLKDAASFRSDKSMPFSESSFFNESLPAKASLIFAKNLSRSKFAFVMVMNKPSIINLSNPATTMPASSAFTPTCDKPFNAYIIRSCRFATSLVLPHTPT